MRYLLGLLGVSFAVVGIIFAGAEMSDSWWLPSLAGLVLFLVGFWLMLRSSPELFD